MEISLEQSDLISSPIELATELTIAWLSNPNTRAQADEIPSFLRAMHAAVTALDGGEASASAPEQETQHVPAVTVRKSLASKEHILSLIDGKPYKTLRRHLGVQGLTPEQYRERYNLKPDYPMVAPAYSEARRGMAKKIGLGRKGGRPKADATPSAVEAAPGRRGREPKTASEE